jgi:hypothetical protein
MNCGAEYMRQYAPNMAKIEGFGFLLADNLPGPFQLEVDYLEVTNLDNRHDFMDETSEEYADAVLKHVWDPKKKRQDWVDSAENDFGFGFDLGPGAIETKQSHVRGRFLKQTHGAYLNSTNHPHFEIVVNPKKQRQRSKES